MSPSIVTVSLGLVQPSSCTTTFVMSATPKSFAVQPLTALPVNWNDAGVRQSSMVACARLLEPSTAIVARSATGASERVRFCRIPEMLLMTKLMVSPLLKSRTMRSNPAPSVLHPEPGRPPIARTENNTDPLPNSWAAEGFR